MKRLSLSVLLFSAALAAASESPPGAIGEFSAIHFPDGIAAKGQPFNATDVIEEGRPSRRIVAYLVTSSASFLWYEHGGRGYHQHLVRFDTLEPEAVAASYVFLESPPHQQIGDLIADTEFLKRHESRNSEL